MIFCENCFKDIQIKSIIKSLNKKGTCPICKKKQTYLYDTSSDTSLQGLLDDLLLIYVPASKLPDTYPRSELHMVSDELKNEWNMFSKDLLSHDIYDIIKSISSNLFSEEPKLFEEPVGIPQKNDKEYLKKHSILRGYTWEQFVEVIKFDNRFHTNIINKDLLETYLSYLRKDYLKDTIMFRGRLLKKDVIYTPKDMGAPPASYSKEGRANSVGIQRLYLADSIETCIHEIRAGAFDSLAIGKFKLTRDIAVIDFKKINDFSPFNEEFDFLEYFINKPILSKIDKEMAKTVRSNDNNLDYIPTQYLCDFIKTLKYSNESTYDGVEYSSTLNQSGYNLAIFNPSIFKCTKVDRYDINQLNYTYTRIHK